MFDLLKFEYNTLTLFRLDTCKIWFVIWIYCKHWEYLRYLLSNFLQFKYQDHRDYCTQKQDCNVAIQNINISPWISCFINFTELGFNITHNTVVKRKQQRPNKQLFHLHTFKPAASGVRQTLYFRETVESCRKLYIHNNNMVT